MAETPTLSTLSATLKAAVTKSAVPSYITMAMTFLSDLLVLVESTTDSELANVFEKNLASLIIDLQPWLVSWAARTDTPIDDKFVAELVEAAQIIHGKHSK